jgi:thiol-disulfide isomerase/thioredoxin
MVMAQPTNKITVINRDTDMVNLYYMGHFFYGNPVMVDSLGTTTILTNDTIYLISSNNQQLVKVTCGDTVWIKGTQLFVNNFTALNTFFRDLYSAYGPIRNVSMKSYTSNAANLAERDRLINAMQQKRMAFLRDYRGGLSEEEKTTLANIIHCAAIAERLKLQWKGQQKPLPPAYYKDSLSVWANRINLLQYQDRHLLLYEAALKIFQSQAALYKKTGAATALQLFNGPVQQFLYARMIKDSIASFSQRFPSIQALLQNRQWPLTDTTLINGLAAEMLFIQQSKQQPTNGVALMNQAGQIFDLAQVIRGYSGKLVYVDCWASWCVPCLQEMPASKRLQELYAGKPVVFLFVSLDKNQAAWLSSLQNHASTMGSNSYLLMGNFTNPWAVRLNISSIPRYLLYDKSGRLINNNAPRPSEAGLRQVIDKLLIR